MIYTVTLNPAVDREYTVPTLTSDTVLRATNVRVDPGGKGFNVSRLLRVLGAPTVALGIVGGKSGEWLEERLTALGIETAFVWLDGETRTNTTIVTAAGESHLKVNEAGPQVKSVIQDALLTRVVGLVQPNDWWVLAGSLPPGVPTDFYATLIDLIKAKGGHVLLDTSGTALAQGCLAHPDWIKPNEAELADLTGEEDLQAGIDVLAGWGVEQTFISLGRDGAIVVDYGEIGRFSPPTIIEKNPIGAGDALVGGFVWGLSQGMSPLEASRWGIACGATAASKSGTDFGTRDEIEQLVDQVVMV